MKAEWINGIKQFVSENSVSLKKRNSEQQSVEYDSIMLYAVDGIHTVKIC